MFHPGHEEEALVLLSFVQGGGDLFEGPCLHPFVRLQVDDPGVGAVERFPSGSVFDTIMVCTWIMAKPGRHLDSMPGSPCGTQAAEVPDPRPAETSARRATGIHSRRFTGDLLYSDLLIFCDLPNAAPNIVAIILRPLDGRRPPCARIENGPGPIQRPMGSRLSPIAMRSIALIAGLLLLVLAAGCTAQSPPAAGTPAPAVAATTVQPTSPAVSIATGSFRVASAGENATVPILLDSAPNGLSGYGITVTLADPSVAEITAVSFPDWAGMKSSSAVPSGQAVLRAADLSMQVPMGATNLTLATLTVTGRAAGTTGITVTPDPGLGLQDRRGDIYAATPVPGTLAVGG